MRNIHPDLLWQGHAGDLRQHKRLARQSIAAVVDVAYEERPASLPRHFLYCRFPLSDGTGNRDATLLQAIQTVTDLLRLRVPTLVTCSAGMSRSPIVATFGLAALRNDSPENILRELADSKSLEIHPLLWNDAKRVFASVR